MFKKRWILSVVLVVLFSLLGSILFQHHLDSGTPKKIRAEGIPNFVQVSPTLYRSGQPTAEGLNRAEKMGIRTVLNLRNFHSDEDELLHTNLNYIHIPMKPWPLDDDDVCRFLNAVTDTAYTPVLVHCYAGSDRTGTMVAFYRIIVEDWSKEAALEEMTRGGYGFKWFLFPLKGWIRDLDVDRYRKCLHRSCDHNRR